VNASDVSPMHFKARTASGPGIVFYLEGLQG
jgi:hypothetical protein